jgi:hypothetical protein
MRQHGLTDGATTSHHLSNLCVDHLLHCKPNVYLKEHERSETWKP